MGCSSSSTVVTSTIASTDLGSQKRCWVCDAVGMKDEDNRCREPKCREFDLYTCKGECTEIHLCNSHGRETDFKYLEQPCHCIATPKCKAMIVPCCYFCDSKLQILELGAASTGSIDNIVYDPRAPVVSTGITNIIGAENSLGILSGLKGINHSAYLTVAYVTVVGTSKFLEDLPLGYLHRPVCQSDAISACADPKAHVGMEKCRYVCYSCAKEVQDCTLPSALRTNLVPVQIKAIASGHRMLRSGKVMDKIYSGKEIGWHFFSRINHPVSVLLQMLQSPLVTAKTKSEFSAWVFHCMFEGAIGPLGDYKYSSTVLQLLTSDASLGMPAVRSTKHSDNGACNERYHQYSRVYYSLLDHLQQRMSMLQGLGLSVEQSLMVSDYTDCLSEFLISIPENPHVCIKVIPSSKLIDSSVQIDPPVALTKEFEVKI
jgi:hypothetical protein